MPIYFAKVDGRPEIKIGFTICDILHRLSGLQNGNVSTVRCVRLMDGEKRDELALHRRFAANRVRNEWYMPHPDMFGDLGLPDLEIPPLRPLYTDHLAERKANAKPKPHRIKRTQPAIHQQGA